MADTPRAKIGDPFKAKIEGIDEKGRGTLHIGKKAALAYFVVPGEEIAGTVGARNKGTLRTRVMEVTTPSVDRVVPRCPYAGKCGGCPWQMIDYPRQVELKKSLVNEAFAEFAVPLTLEEVTPAKDIFYHRNRMDYVFGKDGALGLKEPERWEGVLDLSTCFMMSEESVKVMSIVRDYVRNEKLEPWDNRAHTGFVRYLVIREGKNTGERLVMLTTSAARETLPNEEALVAALKPLCSTFIHGVNPTITDLSIPHTLRTIFGNEFLNEKVGEHTFKIPPASFFQTNTAMSEVLRDTVLEFAAPCENETVMDLYCGVGFLSLALARDATAVVGVEMDEKAIDAARENAEANHVKNITFSAGATEAMLPSLLSRDKPSIIVVDPPRAGLHPKALTALMEYGAKRLIYVSCNARALARDLVELLKIYKPIQLRAIDLFPHTPHIETIVALERT